MAADKGITLAEHMTLHDEAAANNARPASPTRTPGERRQREIPETLTLSTVLNFGKHKGSQVEDLVYDQGGYLRWMYETEVREFAPEVVKLMKKQGII